MTVSKASSASTPPVVDPAGLGRIWPNPGIEEAGRFSRRNMEAWQDITSVSGLPTGPRPTPNSA
jgi:hypothetical protein